MRIFLPAALALLLVAGCQPEEPRPQPVHDETETVSGTLAYRERVALPPQSRAEVTVARVQDDQLIAIADTSFIADGMIPISFSLSIPEAAVDTTAQHVLTASLSSPDGRLQWRTPRPLPVLTAGAPTEVEAILHMVEQTQEPRPEPWLEARARGVTFRALGQEPGWRMDIYGTIRRPERLELMLNYGDEVRRYDTITTDTDGEGNLRYRAGDGPQAMEAVVEDRQCRDAMSGEIFEALVTLRLKERELSGCGRSLL